jgi:phage-related protein
MAQSKEQLVFETILIDNVTNGLTHIRKVVQDLGNGMQKYTTNTFRTATDKVKELNKSVIQTIPTIKKMKFEWLGVMFAGMALTRTFGGLLRAQMELWGISDMLSATWTTVLLPIMEAITPVIMDVLEAFMDLPEDAQKAIGIFIIAATAIGGLLAFIGQLKLGLAAIKIAFLGAGTGGSVMGGIIGNISTVLAGFSAAVVAVAAIVVAVVIGMVLAWRENFLGMRETISRFIDGFKQQFDGFINMIKGIMKIIGGLLTGDFNKILEGLTQLFKGWFNFIVGGFKMTFNGVVAIITGAIKIIWNIIKALVDGVGWVVGKIGGLLGGSSAPAWKLPSFQTGGVMPETGIALLHKGERVLTAGETRQTGTNGGNANITINATVSSDYDVRRLANKLKEYWVSDFEKTSQGRTI